MVGQEGSQETVAGRENTDLRSEIGEQKHPSLHQK